MNVGGKAGARLGPSHKTMLLAGVLTLQACSLLTNLDALTQDAEPNDAAGASSGGLGTDATTGSSTSGALPGDAASSDAAAYDADAVARSSFCAAAQPAHEFCSDFDEMPVSSGWTSIDTAANAAIELDDLAFSAPHSVRTAVLADGSCTQTMLNKSLGGPYVGGTLSFDIRLGSAQSPVAPEAFVANVLAGDCNHFVQVVATQTFLYTYSGADSNTKMTPVFIPAGQWRRVTLEFDRSDGSVQLSIDGVVVIARAVADARCTGPTGVVVSVGLHCQSQAAEVRYDNVTFDGF